MNTTELIKENVIQVFLNACDNDFYGFLTNLKLENMKEYDIKNYTYVKNPDMSILGKLDERIACHSLDIIAGKINSNWFFCSNEYAVRTIFDLPKENFNSQTILSCLPYNFYEKVWENCQDKDEQKYLIETFSSQLSMASNHIDKLTSLNNNDFFNEVVATFFQKEYRYSPDNELYQIIDLVKAKNFTLTDTNLHKLCKGNSKLKDIKNQAILKNFIEEYMSSSTDALKHIWKKIDTALITEKFMTDDTCMYLSFDKLQIYNLQTDKSVEFYEKRLKAFTTFLNKSKVQNILNIERTVFDGSQESQKHYRFFIISKPNNELSLKDIIEDVLVKSLSIEVELDSKIFQKILHSAILKQELGTDAEIKPNKRNKI